MSQKKRLRRTSQLPYKQAFFLGHLVDWKSVLTFQNQNNKKIKLKDFEITRDIGVKELLKGPPQLKKIQNWQFHRASSDIGSLLDDPLQRGPMIRLLSPIGGKSNKLSSCHNTLYFVDCPQSRGTSVVIALYWITEWHGF